MRTAFAACLLLALGLFASAPVRGESRPQLPRPMKPIEAVNVEVSTVVVQGTVTVRMDGVLVNPPDVTYSFQPEFKNDSGYLFPVADGVYRLYVDGVPADVPHVLTIRSTHNDTVIRDGVVQRLGQTRSGSLRLDIPLGRDYSIGDQLLDLR